MAVSRGLNYERKAYATGYGFRYGGELEGSWRPGGDEN